jgi:hypothetical protein
MMHQWFWFAARMSMAVPLALYCHRVRPWVSLMPEKVTSLQSEASEKADFHSPHQFRPAVVSLVRIHTFEHTNRFIHPMNTSIETTTSILSFEEPDLVRTVSKPGSELTLECLLENARQ